MPHLTQPKVSLITEFELELTLKSGESKEWEYEVEDGRAGGEVEYRHGEEKFKWEDLRALNEVLGLMANLGIRPESPVQELAGRALSILGVTWEQVDELELEVSFDSGETLEFEYEAPEEVEEKDVD